MSLANCRIAIQCCTALVTRFLYPRWIEETIVPAAQLHVRLCSWCVDTCTTVATSHCLGPATCPMLLVSLLGHSATCCSSVRFPLMLCLVIPENGLKLLCTTPAGQVGQALPRAQVLPVRAGALNECHLLGSPFDGIPPFPATS